MKALCFRALSLLLVGGLIFGFAGTMSAQRVAQAKTTQPKTAQPNAGHPLHTALRELQEAKRELEKATHNFGGHKEAAILATEHAIRDIERLVGSERENKKGELKQEHKDEKKAEKKGEKHPALHAALVELRRAHKYVKEANHNFGGQREDALKSIDHAIVQIELALQHA